MKYSKAILSALFLLFIGFILQAQEVIPTSGGSANGSGGSVEYTVGQNFYTTNFGTNGSVAQGVQQPFEISVVSGTNDIDGIALFCSAYPNPTTDYLTLKIESITVENLTYQLFDVSSKLIESKKIIGNETSIQTGNLIPAIYFLKVNQGNIIVKTFKIVKK